MIYLRVLLILSLSIITTNLSAQELQKKTTTRILFLLDGSGSMLSNWEGQTRMERAKELLTELVDSLQKVKNVEVGLRVYGHQYPKGQQNCRDSKLEVPFGANSANNIKQRLTQIRPKGVTPLSYSLEQAAGDFPNASQYRNVLIILTDGIESCGGDPCAVSLALQKKRIFLKPFIIGLGTGKDLADEFKCMGTYYNASKVTDFREIMNKVMIQTLSEVRIRVDLLDGDKKPTETNVNMSFVNSGTHQVEYDFVHLLKPNGKPDEFKIDPVPSYHLVVNTIPPIIKKNIRIVDPGLNIIKVNAARGTLNLTINSTAERGKTTALIRKQGSTKTIHTITLGERVDLLVGTYDLEILTLPRITKTTTIKAGQTNTVRIDIPGLLNVYAKSKGYTSLYKTTTNGREKWIHELTEKDYNNGMKLQPGKYKLVYRSKNALKTTHTIVKRVKILPGSSTSVKF